MRRLILAAALTAMATGSQAATFDISDLPGRPGGFTLGSAWYSFQGILELDDVTGNAALIGTSTHTLTAVASPTVMLFTKPTCWANSRFDQNCYWESMQGVIDPIDVVGKLHSLGHVGSLVSFASTPAPYDATLIFWQARGDRMSVRGDGVLVATRRTTSVPESSTLSLLGVGLLLAGWQIRRDGLRRGHAHGRVW